MPEQKNPRSPLGQNRENLRQHNLSVVLRLLHQEGSVPRSHLTWATGLNRSTISDLVGELVELGLAKEAEAQVQGSVGRPSLTVEASKNVVAFTVNPAADATTVGVVAFDGQLLKRVRYKTPQRPDAQAAATIAAKIIADLRGEMDPDVLIAGIGSAVPGQIRVQDGVVRTSPHLAWVEAPFATLLSQATNLPVFVDNDATSACVAERLYGAGKGSQNAVFLFASSGGIGGGIIADDRLLRGASGYAGELGHIQVSASRETDYSGFSGTLEALVKREDLLYAFHLDTATDEELETLIASNTSARVTKLLNTQLENLGRGVAQLATIFNPQTVILSGFLKSIFNQNPERLLATIRGNSMSSVNESLVVKTGELGTSAVLIGAAELAFQAVLDSPAGTRLTVNRR